MTINLTRRLTPEEEELEKKRRQLMELEAELAERELELTTFQAELHTFEREYLRVVGVRYAELDEIEAEIARYLAFLNPKDAETRKQAEEAWTKAQDSKQATREAEASARAKDSEQTTDENTTDGSKFLRDFKPLESLKKVYREVAKRIHPDLATDEVERQRRQQLMAEANQAYEDGDEERLCAILREWENSPESVQGEGVEAELLRTIRKIAQVRERLNKIEVEIEALKRLKPNELKTEELETEKELDKFYCYFAIAPQGKNIAGGTADGLIKIFDLDTGKLLYILSGNSRSDLCFTTSPDGRNITSGSSVLSVTFSPDGQTLVSGSLDGSINIWRVFPLVESEESKRTRCTHSSNR